MDTNKTCTKSLRRRLDVTDYGGSPHTVVLLFGTMVRATIASTYVKLQSTEYRVQVYPRGAAGALYLSDTRLNLCTRRTTYCTITTTGLNMK